MAAPVIVTPGDRTTVGDYYDNTIINSGFAQWADWGFGELPGSGVFSYWKQELADMSAQGLKDVLSAGYEMNDAITVYTFSKSDSHHITFYDTNTGKAIVEYKMNVLGFYERVR